jgi:hypothetical protein
VWGSFSLVHCIGQIAARPPAPDCLDTRVSGRRARHAIARASRHAWRHARLTGAGTATGLYSVSFSSDSRQRLAHTTHKFKCIACWEREGFALCTLSKASARTASSRVHSSRLIVQRYAAYTCCRLLHRVPCRCNLIVEQTSICLVAHPASRLWKRVHGVTILVDQGRRLYYQGASICAIAHI